MHETITLFLVTLPNIHPITLAHACRMHCSWCSTGLVFCQPYRQHWRSGLLTTYLLRNFFRFLLCTAFNRKLTSLCVLSGIYICVFSGITRVYVTEYQYYESTFNSCLLAFYSYVLYYLYRRVLHGYEILYLSPQTTSPSHPFPQFSCRLHPILSLSVLVPIFLHGSAYLRSDPVLASHIVFTNKEISSSS